MSEPILPQLKLIAVKERISVLFIEKGNLDVLDGAFADYQSDRKLTGAK